MGSGGLRILPALRLSKAAALLTLFAILCRAVIPAGWMPVFASTSGQGFSIIICTAAGPSHLLLDANGVPGKPAPGDDSSQEHQLCPFAAAPVLAPPANLVVILVPQFESRPIVLAELGNPRAGDQHYVPHSSRAPPYFV